MNVTTTNTRQKILVVDDNELVRKTIVLTLLSAQYEVAEASDGIVGLKAVAEAPFDLVITDILMPNMEGIETMGDCAAVFTFQIRQIVTGRRQPHLWFRKPF